jgi:hypothetical protein
LSAGQGTGKSLPPLPLPERQEQLSGRLSIKLAFDIDEQEVAQLPRLLAAAICLDTSLLTTDPVATVLGVAPSASKPNFKALKETLSKECIGSILASKAPAPKSLTQGTSWGSIVFDPAVRVALVPPIEPLPEWEHWGLVLSHAGPAPTPWLPILPGTLFAVRALYDTTPQRILMVYDASSLLRPALQKVIPSVANPQPGTLLHVGTFDSPSLLTDAQITYVQDEANGSGVSGVPDILSDLSSAGGFFVGREVVANALDPNLRVGLLPEDFDAGGENFPPAVELASECASITQDYRNGTSPCTFVEYTGAIAAIAQKVLVARAAAREKYVQLFSKEEDQETAGGEWDDYFAGAGSASTLGGVAKFVSQYLRETGASVGAGSNLYGWAKSQLYSKNQPELAHVLGKAYDLFWWAGRHGLYDVADGMTPANLDSLPGNPYATVLNARAAPDISKTQDEKDEDDDARIARLAVLADRIDSIFRALGNTDPETLAQQSRRHLWSLVNAPELGLVAGIDQSGSSKECAADGFIFFLNYVGGCLKGMREYFKSQGKTCPKFDPAKPLDFYRFYMEIGYTLSLWYRVTGSVQNRKIVQYSGEKMADKYFSQVGKEDFSSLESVVTEMLDEVIFDKMKEKVDSVAAQLSAEAQAAPASEGGESSPENQTEEQS